MASRAGSRTSEHSHGPLSCGLGSASRDNIAAPADLKGDPMLATLWVMLQFFAVVLSADGDAMVPQTSTHFLIIALLGAAFLTPFGPWAVHTLIRVLSLAPRRPLAARVDAATPDFSLPAEPGTPGTALARAPSRLVSAGA